MPADLLILGQLLGVAAAAGLNLYATLAVLGIASRYTGLIALPPELRGLEHGLLIGTAAALYVVEFLLDKLPPFGAFWDTLHTVIRPAAAALLALGLLASLPPGSQAIGAALAGGMALAIHGTKAGLRLTLFAESHPGTMQGVSLAEDVLAVGIALVAIAYPDVAVAVVAAALVVAAVAGPRCWRAFVLWLRALRARVRGFFRPPGWHHTGALPRRLRRLVPDPPLGSPAARATRAAVAGLGGIGHYTNGWLVVSGQGYRFLYRSAFGAQQRPIDGIRSQAVRRGLWVDAVELQTDDGLYTLFLLKDGPPPELALAELVISER